MQTRQKFKEAYAQHFAATIERAEKQIILARHGRRLLNLLDDNPVVPGDVRPTFEHAAQARQILNDVEDDLRDWRPDYEPVQTAAGSVQSNLMPATTTTSTTATTTAAGQHHHHPHHHEQQHHHHHHHHQASGVGTTAATGNNASADSAGIEAATAAALGSTSAGHIDYSQYIAQQGQQPQQQHQQQPHEYTTMPASTVHTSPSTQDERVTHFAA